MSENQKTFPRELEDEAIYILREAAAQFERPAILFSGGKDSITLVRLAQKAFYPGKIPFLVQCIYRYFIQFYKIHYLFLGPT